MSNRAKMQSNRTQLWWYKMRPDGNWDLTERWFKTLKIWRIMKNGRFPMRSVQRTVNKQTFSSEPERALVYLVSKSFPRDKMSRVYICETLVVVGKAQTFRLESLTIEFQIGHSKILFPHHFETVGILRNRKCFSKKSRI